MESYSSKLAIVTGANNGIGFETALGLAEAGYHVTMGCRNQLKAEKAKAAIIDRVPSASLDILLIDLGDFDSVRGFVRDFRHSHTHLNLLINNAGILTRSTNSNDHNIELQFATNHLGHFLLTALLLDLMPDDASSRIVHLSSLAHKGAQIKFDDLHRNGNGLDAYGQSKLACLLFGDELARRIRASDRKVRSITVHPGGSDSGLFDEMARWQYYLFKVVSPLLMATPKSAAKPSLYAALGLDAEGGAYYGPQGLGEFRGRVGNAKRDSISADLDLAQQLWTVSEQLTSQPFTIEQSQVESHT